MTAPFIDVPLSNTNYCFLYTQWNNELSEFVFKESKRTGKEISLSFVPAEQCIQLGGERIVIDEFAPRFKDYVHYLTKDVHTTSPIQLKSANGNFNWKSIWVPVNKRKQSEIQKECAVLPLNKKEGICMLVGPQPKLGQYEQWFRKTYQDGASSGRSQSGNTSVKQKRERAPRVSYNQMPYDYSNEPTNRGYRTELQIERKEPQAASAPKQNYSQMGFDYSQQSKPQVQQKPKNDVQKKEKPKRVDYSQMGFDYSQDTPKQQTNKPTQPAQNKQQTNTTPQLQKQAQQSTQPQQPQAQQKKVKEQPKHVDYSQTGFDYNALQQDYSQGITLKTIKMPLTLAQSCYIFTHNLRQFRKHCDDVIDSGRILAFSDDFNSRSEYIEIGASDNETMLEFKNMILRVIQNLETTPMFKIPKQSQLDYIVVPMDSRRRHIFQKDCSVSFHSTSDEIVLVGRQPKLEVFERWVKTMIGERTISPKVIVVVDTNIFGHREEQRYLDQIYTNDDIAIGIPERVRAELDRMKSFKNDTAFTARDALRNIGACSLMPNKTIAQLDGQYPKIRFDIKKEDDEIVSYALYLAEQVGKKVALVTRDQGMKQRAVAYAKYLDVFPGMRSFVSSTYVASDIDSLTENVKRIAIDQDAVSDDDAESWETVSDSEDEM